MLKEFNRILATLAQRVENLRILGIFMITNLSDLLFPTGSPRLPIKQKFSKIKFKFEMRQEKLNQNERNVF